MTHELTYPPNLLPYPNEGETAEVIAAGEVVFRTTPMRGKRMKKMLPSIIALSMIGGLLGCSEEVKPPQDAPSKAPVVCTAPEGLSCIQ